MMFLKILQNSQENTCAGVSFLIKFQGFGFIKKGAVKQLCTCEFCEIFTNIFFKGSSPVAASQIDTEIL